jgi:hypothetical protein
VELPKLCARCRKAVAVSAVFCVNCAAVVAAVEHDETPSARVEVSPIHHEFEEQPHTELREPGSQFQVIRTYTTSSDPIQTSAYFSLQDWAMLGAVDSERAEKPHTPEREAEDRVSTASYAVTGVGVLPDAATEPGAQDQPFLNRAARRKALRPSRRASNG